MLSFAAKGGNRAVMKLILAGVGAVWLHSRDMDGRTALHHAAREGHLEAYLLLIKAGALVDAIDKSGNTPLQLLVKAGYPIPNPTGPVNSREREIASRAAEKAYLQDVIHKSKIELKEPLILEEKIEIFIVDLHWLKVWRRHLEDLDTALPGPIANHSLLDEDGLPRQGLLPGKDYKGLRRRLWELLLGRYGGGPPLPRHARLDIYYIYNPES